jgi:hypothetical protein
MSPNEKEPPSEPNPDEIRVFERPERGSGGRTWIPVAILAAGLGLSFLMTRHGSFFFFLPIIVPFGFGGGSLFRRWRRGARQRPN